MGFFQTIKGPVFLKESSCAVDQLQQLKTLAASVSPTLKGKIEQDIRMLQAGIAGEEAIAFELKNSHMPMAVLHDLYLRHGDLSAQIDYLVVTRKRIFVLETKNLFGNIEINKNGDFIRTMHYNGKFRKEGIYSPITQNRRHLELLRQLRLESKRGIILQTMFQKGFYDVYRPVIVLSNPKTVLNMRYAPKEVSEQVIRADQLISYIQKVNMEPGAGATETSEQQMLDVAQFFLSLHQEEPVDYTAKYREQVDFPAHEEEEPQPCAQTAPSPPSGQNAEASASVVCPKCGAPMVLRRATKGERTGKEFYGCSRFPKCRGIINL